MRSKEEDALSALSVWPFEWISRRGRSPLADRATVEQRRSLHVAGASVARAYLVPNSLAYAMLTARVGSWRTKRVPEHDDAIQEWTLSILQFRSRILATG